MADGARSTDLAVQAQLDRLFAAGPGTDVLGLDRIARLLARIGDPHLRLPPVFHVAGTNGKGSTCAFLRAMLAAAGFTVHVYTSPHLVRFNERIRIAGALIDDDVLALLLAEVLDAGADIGASFFEVTTAAAFLAFARTPADACIIEVGLGGRLDATNIIPAPLVCGIASLGIDHEAFLLAPEAGTPDDPLDRIAFEKAGIAKAGVPLLTQGYCPSMTATIREVAARAGATVMPRGPAWDGMMREDALHYHDRHGALTLPIPAMAGAHQADNAMLAIAMLRHQNALCVKPDHLALAMGATQWPARLQRLVPGPLTAGLPEHSIVWLDGGHNPDAGIALAAALSGGPPFHVICGMLANKDALGFLTPFADRIASFQAVPIPGHAHHDPARLCAVVRQALSIADAAHADDVVQALSRLAATPSAPILICGSLYLAGDVLRLNHQLPV